MATFSTLIIKKLLYHMTLLLLVSGVLCDGLYLLDIHSISDVGKNSVFNFLVGNKHGRMAEKSSMLWHKCLGHISSEK